MAKVKVTIMLDERLLRLIDRWVSEGRYSTRSQVVQAAIREHVERWSRARLAEEVVKLDPREERALADERLAMDA